MNSAKASTRVLPFTPAVPEPIQSSTEAATRYAPRIVRAVVVLLGAVSMHLFGIPAPHPGQMPVAAFASRMMRLPLVPMAPPLRVPALSRSSAVSNSRVTVETRTIRVSPLPAIGVSPRGLRAEQMDVPVGTSGHVVLAAFPKSSPDASRVAAAPMAVKSSEAAVVTPSPAEAPAQPSAAPDHVVASASGPPRLETSSRPAESGRAAALTPPAADRGRKEPAQEETEVVLALLREYSRAYGRMDVRATKAVYPSVDDRRLRRAFEDLQGQQLHFASCSVAISSSGAGGNAWCRGDATFRPKIGSPVYLTNREWTFSLGRHGSDWQILKATMQ